MSRYWHSFYPRASEFSSQYATASTSLNNDLTELTNCFTEISEIYQSSDLLKNDELQGDYYDIHYSDLVDKYKESLKEIIDDLEDSVAALPDRIREVDAKNIMWQNSINDGEWRGSDD